MINFKQISGEKDDTDLINPIQIYNNLDRRSDKGDLRGVQENILNQWFGNYRDSSELIVKLHTGEGKTLIGLLILQSYLNEKKGPVLYLCPNTYLVNQTCKQAKIFGFAYSTEIEKMPEEYEKNDPIYITTCQKLFNGKSKFGYNSKSKNVYAIIMDDAHQCLNAIGNSFKIVITRKDNPSAFSEMVSLFDTELTKQGAGTFAEIKAGNRDSFTPVPYWGWIDKINEVTSILADHSFEEGIEFPWNLLKDNMKDCECIVSGDKIEIYPIVSLVSKFGSYEKAKHKIFMSATWNDDAFLIKTLGIKSCTIRTPLADPKSLWSGEKMILLPEVINSEEGKRDKIIVWVNKVKKANAKYGIVSLVPSFSIAKEWEKAGSFIATKENLYEIVDKLSINEKDQVITIANRYDGIDLPDSSCRILIIDSLPQGDSLEEKLIESCMDDSEILRKKKAQTIEQGLGRAVRGSRDYCVIIIIGSDLVNFVQSNKTKKYFSQQTRLQVEIGKKISDMVSKDQKESGSSFNKCLSEIINQSLSRDPGWKDYYATTMSQLKEQMSDYSILTIFESELQAEKYYKEKQYEKAISVIQELIDNNFQADQQQKGWYLQKMARYAYSFNKDQSYHYQITAHKNNSYLLSVEDDKLLTLNNTINFERMDNIDKWLRGFTDYQDINLEIEEILNKLVFAGDSDKFEKAIKDIGKFLGYESTRPDKELKNGPDNLWKISNNKYLLIECKNEVNAGRQFISRDEVGQMSRSCTWFSRKFPGCNKSNIMIITTNKLEREVYFSEEVNICLQIHLEKFKRNIKSYLLALEKYEFGTWTQDKINDLLIKNNLDNDSILSEYSCETKNIK